MREDAAAAVPATSQTPEIRDAGAQLGERHEVARGPLRAGGGTGRALLGGGRAQPSLYLVKGESVP